MIRETFDDSKVVEWREAVGTEWVIYDKKGGVEIGREPLTAEELIQFQNEGKPTRDEKLATDITAASTIAGIKDAILAWIGG